MFNYVEPIPAALDTLLGSTLEPGELILVQMKGIFKEALICTDQRVLILKKGLSTGQAFGNGLYQQPYASISGVEVKFSLLSGYFELSAGGMQNAAKNYWSNQKGTSPQTSPNCVSINNKEQANRFRQAASFILQKADEARRTPVQSLSPSNSSSAVLDTIQRMSELNAQGILTDQEFSAKKAELLALL